MKTIQKSAYLFLIALAFVLTSCGKKTEDVNPDAGAEVAGTYKVSQLRTPSGQVGTISGGTLDIIVTRVNETQARASLRSVPTGQAARDIPVTGTFDLTRSGDDINFLAAAGKVGFYNKGNIEFTVNGTDLAGTLIGKKQ